MILRALAVLIITSTVIGPSLQANNLGAQEMTPARNGDLAVEEEFHAAEASDTVAAWKLFIARNPDHRLVDEARRRLSSKP